MSQALLKKFRRAKQGSSEQKEILRRAKNDLRRNKILGLKPSSALQTIIKEFKPETKKQLKEKADSAREGAAWMAGGPLVKGGIKAYKAGRAALAGLPKGITKVRDGFKFGDKTYKTLGGAKGAATRAAKKPPTPPAKPKLPADQVAAASRASSTARGRPSKLAKKFRKQTNAPPIYGGGAKVSKAIKPGKLKNIVKKSTVPAILATIGGRELIKDKTIKGKPQAAEAAAAPKKENRSQVTKERKPKVKKRIKKQGGPDELSASYRRDELIPKGAEPQNRATYDASAGRTSRGNKGYETMREYFVEDSTPRKSKVKTPLGIIDIDTKEDMDAETRDILEMAQKKGGRLRKGKIKTSTRKRAALRGHRAELRGG